MVQQDRTSRRRVIGMIVTTVTCATMSGYTAFHFARTRSADARAHKMFWLVISGLWLITGLLRILRRNKRNPFEEEIAHRRALVRDDYNPSGLKANC
jgi:hypothetical protein